jgi:hypothetical protein
LTSLNAITPAGRSAHAAIISSQNSPLRAGPRSPLLEVHAVNDVIAMAVRDPVERGKASFLAEVRDGGGFVFTNFS